MHINEDKLQILWSTVEFILTGMTIYTRRHYMYCVDNSIGSVFLSEWTIVVLFLLFRGR